jgi:enamine deaminase RidA (YjgF/YER057c/UK114 family)
MTRNNEYVNPPTLFESTPHGFSQAVVASGSRTVHVSGQTAWNAGKTILGGRDLAAQARHALENLRLAMRACGGDLADVVSLRIYVVGDPSEASKASAVGDALREFFPEDARPASTWVGVTALARPEFLVEIEATGVLD